MTAPNPVLRKSLDRLVGRNGVGPVVEALAQICDEHIEDMRYGKLGGFPCAERNFIKLTNSLYDALLGYWWIQRDNHANPQQSSTPNTGA